MLEFARQRYCRSLAEPVTAGEVAEVHRGNALLYAHRTDTEFA
ncbi:hypothetical protein [Nocardia brasiliensis]|nr:hypothetical protein [Nocardia brasiliensis]